MNIIFSHPTGNANVRAAATGFAEADVLKEFHTSLAVFPGSMLDRMSRIGIFSDFQRRGFDPVLKSRTKTSPWKELVRLSAPRIGLSKFTTHETGRFCIDSVYKNIDRQVASRIKHPAIGIDAVFAYEDGAVFSFQEAKKRGLQCFYDLPTGHWRAARRLLEEEKLRHPDWASTITGFRDSEIKLNRKDEELRLADRIFVASTFTANTLKEFPGKLAPVEVIPYGFPRTGKARNYEGFSKKRPLKLLFVGKLTQQKGIADLFQAVEKLGKKVELTVVGYKAEKECAPLEAALEKYRWFPSLPHNQVLELMRTQDILIFPSLFDGFGLVISEAMSQGTPVIATNRCAGPDLIKHGENGWLVEAGSAPEIQGLIEEILTNPQCIARAGKMAMETASKRPWEVYQQELIRAIIRHSNT